MSSAKTVGFPTYYVATRLLLDKPDVFDRAYDPDWFVPQLFEYGTGLYDMLNAQPPAVSLIMLPVAWLPPAEAKELWGILGMGFLAMGTGLLARACGLGMGSAILVTTLPLLTSPVLQNTRQGQVYLFLYLLECWFLAASIQGRQRLAGVPLGIAAVTKTALLWAWPLLVVARFRSTLSWAAGTVVVVSLLVLARVGTAAWPAYAATVVEKLGSPTGSVTAYQTIHSLVTHLFRYDAQWNPWPVVDAPLVASALSIGIRALVLLVSWRWLLGLGDRREERSLALAMMLAPATVVMPAAEEYHFVLTLAPLLVAWVWAWRRGAGVAAIASLGIVTLLVCAFYDAEASEQVRGWEALLAYPRLYGTLGLWGWLGWALRRERRGMARAGGEVLVR